MKREILDKIENQKYVKQIIVDDFPQIIYKIIL